MSGISFLTSLIRRTISVRSVGCSTTSSTVSTTSSFSIYSSTEGSSSAFSSVIKSSTDGRSLMISSSIEGNSSTSGFLSQIYLSSSFSPVFNIFANSAVDPTNKSIINC
jgi:hypothetical protein